MSTRSATPVLAIYGSIVVAAKYENVIKKKRDGIVNTEIHKLSMEPITYTDPQRDKFNTFFSRSTDSSNQKRKKYRS